MASFNRNEIHALYDNFEKLQEPVSKNISVDKFENFMRQVKSIESDTQKQFWFKEHAGIFFGPGLAGVFGGIYIYKVGFTLYDLFLHENAKKLSPESIMRLTYAGALILSVVQNTLQIRSTYEVFKSYAIKFSRACNKDILKRNPFLSSPEKRNITHTQQFQEWFSDILVPMFAIGAAATRAQLCLKYMKDPSLLSFVLAGTSIAFFSTFYWAIDSYFESMTETGKKRSEILVAIKAKIIL